MATNQGFKGAFGEPYIYQETTSAKSSAVGFDNVDGDKFKITALDTVGATPGTGPATGDIIIDTATDTVSVNGAGGFTVARSTITVTDFAATPGVVYVDNAGVFSPLDTSTAPSGYVLTSTGTGPTDIPAWSAIPASGVTSITGTTNQVNVSASTGSVTISTPTTFIAPGTITATTTVTALSGSVTATAGNFVSTAASNSAGTTGHITIGGVNALNMYRARNVWIGELSGNLGNGAGTVDNVAIGYNTLNNLGSGNETHGNVAVGSGALQLLYGQGNTRNFNVAVGYQALGNGGAPANSVAIGYRALYPSDGGAFNIGLGYNAGSSISTGGNSNIYIQNIGASESNTLRIGAATGTGDQQLNRAFINGIYGASIGSTSGVTLVDSSSQLGSLSGSANTFLVGGTAPSFSANPTASGTITGNALVSTTTVTVGSNLLLPTTTSSVGSILVNSTRFVSSLGTENTFIGSGSGNYTTSGTGLNSGFGYQALNAISTGGQNTACGAEVLKSITTSDNNTAIGSRAGSNLLTGSTNLLIGYVAGIAYTGSESNNILIGNIDGVAGQNNRLQIGKATGTGTGELSTAFINGISGVTVTGSAVLISTGGQMGTVVSSLRFKENVQPMDTLSEDIYKLNPVSFTFKKNPEMGVQPGLIAEEVAQVMPSLVINDEEGPFSVKYHELPVLLLNEIKKLQARIKVLEDAYANANHS